MSDLFAFIDRDLAPSDFFVFVAFLAGTWFALTYAIGSPWWRVNQHGLIGVMTLLHSWSVASLLFLIMWGTVFGQRVDEGGRLPIAIFLAFATVTKVVILHVERRTGRIARREARHHNREKELA